MRYNSSIAPITTNTELKQGLRFFYCAWLVIFGLIWNGLIWQPHVTPLLTFLISVPTVIAPVLVAYLFGIKYQFSPSGGFILTRKDCKVSSKIKPVGLIVGSLLVYAPFAMKFFAPGYYDHLTAIMMDNSNQGSLLILALMMLAIVLLIISSRGIAIEHPET